MLNSCNILNLILQMFRSGGAMTNTTDYKSPNVLMRHLRDNGISISGSSQKQQLINTGYFHGYKGYRFFVSSSNRLPFTSYNEINATIQYDTKLKSLLYGKIITCTSVLLNMLNIV